MFNLPTRLDGHPGWAPPVPEIIAHANAITGITNALTPAEKRSFSVRRAILQLAGLDKAPLEHEISAAIETKLGRASRGMYVPLRLNLQASGLDTKTNAAGNYLVPTEVRDLIELLRNRTRVIELGATVFDGLVGNVQFPRELTASAASWVAENPGSDVGESDGTFGALTLSPKTAMCTTSFSRQLLAQASPDVENLVRRQLATAHALAIDAAALDGSGSANQPLGLLRTTGVGSVVISAGGGGAPTFAKVLELETAIADVSADSDNMKLLTTPIMRAKMRQIFTVPTYGDVPLWGTLPGSRGVGDVLGYAGYVSKQVPANKTSGANSDCHCIILGDWSGLLIGLWGVLELLVDPYAKKKQNLIEATSFQLVDIGVRQPAAFSAIQDARAV